MVEAAPAPGSGSGGAVPSPEQALRDRVVRLRFLTDNRDCVTTIPESARNMGYAAGVQREQGCYAIELWRD